MAESARATPTRHSMTIGQAEDKLLRAVGRYPYLTAEQATQLLYSPGSLKYVMEKLSTLAERKYLVRAGRRLGIKSVYVLARKGARYVDSVGAEVKLCLQPSEIEAKSLQHLLHTMAVNDFLMSLERLCQGFPQFQIASMLHDLELKHRPVAVTLPDGTTRRVIPDSWIDLHIAGQWRECFTVEIDRGFIEQKRWRRKIRALVAFMKGPYQKTFGTQSLRITVVATPGVKRRDDLLRWTEAELTLLGEEAVASTFWFTGLSPAGVVPEELWLSPVWYLPYARQAVQLLVVEEADGP